MSENEEETNNKESESGESVDPFGPTRVDPKRAFEMGAETPDAQAIPAHWSPPEPEVLAPLFPDYDLAELIGRGGMGAVYRGTQKSLDRPVAIKVLPPEMAEADPTFAARFEHEAKSMARLDHPNIVHVYDFGRTEAGHWFIVMEFVDGMDFHQLIRSGELDQTGALNAVSQICDALQYAHEQGYVHRDIKPANIFINQKGLLKVGDFGLAKMIEGDSPDAGHREQPILTQTGFSMGTPDYCAPEQIEGGPIDRRADIYSLGVMFYEMLTRELPRGNFPPPSKKVQVDVRIDDVVLRAMESEPEMRYSTAGEMRTEVDEVRTGAAAAPLPAALERRPHFQSTSAKSAGDRSVAKNLIVLAGLVGILGFFSVAIWLGFLILKRKGTVKSGDPSAEVMGSRVSGVDRVPAATFPLSPPPVPFRPEVQCRLIVVPSDPDFPAAPDPISKIAEERDLGHIVEFAPFLGTQRLRILLANGVAYEWQVDKDGLASENEKLPSYTDLVSIGGGPGIRGSGVLGPVYQDEFKPDPAFTAETIVQTAATHPLRLALTPSGQLLYWGPYREKNELGDMVDFLESATGTVGIAANPHHIPHWVFLSRTGTVHVWERRRGKVQLSPAGSLISEAVRLGGQANSLILANGTVELLGDYDEFESTLAALGEPFTESHVWGDNRAAFKTQSGSWLFFDQLKQGGRRLEHLETALQDAAGFQWDATGLIRALVPKDEVTRSGYWLPAHLAEERKNPGSAAGSPLPPEVTSLHQINKDAPLTNGLGMKFVPVPISGGLSDARLVLFSVWETRVQDYRAFAEETGREWPATEYEQADDHPAVNVNWEDATAFCAWLTERDRKEGIIGASQHYRLPTDHEWSCAAGIADREDPWASIKSKQPPRDGLQKVVPNDYAWGRNAYYFPKFGNYQGAEKLAGRKAGIVPGYKDGYAATAPVGSYKPTEHGLYDLGGNAREICDGWFDESKKERLRRGGCWVDWAPNGWRYSDRHLLRHEIRDHVNGFRCVLSGK